MYSDQAYIYFAVFMNIPSGCWKRFRTINVLPFFGDEYRNKNASIPPYRKGI